ncbi:molybdate ABC transporter substrate-binding protein [Agreia sp. COWG]|uniref:molybdate ABC transporter substrate-binding protein n=1 Tax=Agreia sp. COWG TaxID=2773266 RepID=UPI001927EAF7|nr:molybdate ABC transporter substrate-binding protein [Agreia sp. COWG]CAD5995239.1 Molybdate-binding protein ModA [Agreia sp. COWG]
MKKIVLVSLSLAAAAALLAGCSATAADSAGGSATSSATAAEPQTLTVFAAASLKDTFSDLASEFEDSHPGVTVSLNFAGSADLVTQVTEGAPADVVAFADEKNMKKLTDASLISGTPSLFASNTLTIAVPPDNPAGITSFNDLAKPDANVVICAAQVPCGSATVKIEQATGVTLTPVSEESAVTDVLGKVSSGEADAGLVYVTDVTAAGDSVKGISFPEASGAVNKYPIGIVNTTKLSELATQFQDLVTGADGQKILAAAGFAKP